MRACIYPEKEDSEEKGEGRQGQKREGREGGREGGRARTCSELVIGKAA